MRRDPADMPTPQDLANDNGAELAEKALAALREYAEHQSWRCEYPDQNWYLIDPSVVPIGDCPCGLLSTLASLGIDP